MHAHTHVYTCVCVCVCMRDSLAVLHGKEETRFNIVELCTARCLVCGVFQSRLKCPCRRHSIIFKWYPGVHFYYNTSCCLATCSFSFLIWKGFQFKFMKFIYFSKSLKLLLLIQAGILISYSAGVHFKAQFLQWCFTCYSL